MSVWHMIQSEGKERYHKQILGRIEKILGYIWMNKFALSCSCSQLAGYERVLARDLYSCKHSIMPKLINPSGNMASLQNRQVSIYLSASHQTNMYLKIHSSPIRKILFSTHIHKHACPSMHPERTGYSRPDLWTSVNAAKPPYISAATKLETNKQRGKNYLASFICNIKIPGRQDEYQWQNFIKNIFRIGRDYCKILQKRYYMV